MNIKHKFSLICIFFFFIIHSFAFPFLFDSHTSFISDFSDTKFPMAFRNIQDNIDELQEVKAGDYFILVNTTYQIYDITAKDKELLKNGYIRTPCYVALYSDKKLFQDITLLKITATSSLENKTFEINKKFDAFSPYIYNENYFETNIDYKPYLEFKVGSDGLYSIEATIAIDEDIYKIKYNFCVQRKQHFFRMID